MDQPIRKQTFGEGYIGIGDGTDDPTLADIKRKAAALVDVVADLSDATKDEQIRTDLFDAIQDIKALVDCCRTALEEN